MHSWFSAARQPSLLIPCLIWGCFLELGGRSWGLRRAKIVPEITFELTQPIPVYDHGTSTSQTETTVVECQ